MSDAKRTYFTNFQKYHSAETLFSRESLFGVPRSPYMRSALGQIGITEARKDQKGCGQGAEKLREARSRRENCLLSSEAFSRQPLGIRPEAAPRRSVVPIHPLLVDQSLPEHRNILREPESGHGLDRKHADVPLKSFHIKRLPLDEQTLQILPTLRLHPPDILIRQAWELLLSLIQTGTAMLPQHCIDKRGTELHVRIRRPERQSENQ